MKVMLLLHFDLGPKLKHNARGSLSVSVFKIALSRPYLTNGEVRGWTPHAIGAHDDLLTMVKKWKLRLFGNILRSSGMSKTILQKTVKVERRRGMKNTKWEEIIKEWTRMYERSLEIPCGQRNNGTGEKYCCNIIRGVPTSVKFKDVFIFLLYHYSRKANCGNYTDGTDGVSLENDELDSSTINRILNSADLGIFCQFLMADIIHNQQYSCFINGNFPFCFIMHKNFVSHKSGFRGELNELK